MSLDPQCQALIELVNQTGGAPFDATDQHAAREAYRNSISLYTHPAPDLGDVSDRQIDGPDGAKLSLRIYSPLGDGLFGALVFFHGGGWAVGDLDTHDHVCRYLAGKSGVKVIAVDYRLAPEHVFPAAFDDCIHATCWVHENAATLNIDPARIGVGGDSAGGNLAAACTIALREHESLALTYQLLIYPACDFTASHPSLRENGEGYLLTARAMEQFISWYVPDQQQRADYRASPQLAQSHAKLPAAHIITAGYDPLRDDGRVYADTLKAANVPTDYQCYAGMVHGFLRMGAKLDVAIQALDEAAAKLRDALGPENT